MPVTRRVLPYVMQMSDRPSAVPGDLSRRLYRVLPGLPGFGLNCRRKGSHAAWRSHQCLPSFYLVLRYANERQAISCSWWPLAPTLPGFTGFFYATTLSHRVYRVYRVSFYCCRIGSHAAWRSHQCLPSFYLVLRYANERQAISCSWWPLAPTLLGFTGFFYATTLSTASSLPGLPGFVLLLPYTISCRLTVPPVFT